MYYTLWKYVVARHFEPMCLRTHSLCPCCPAHQVLDTNGNLRYIAVADLPTTPTTDYTRRCPTTWLFSFSGQYSGYTGLSAGFRSDVSDRS